jgi:peptide/nickel transport system substrate-binding protein
MMNRMIFQRTLQCVLALIVIVSAAGCTIEGGAPIATPTEPAAPLQQQTDQVASEALAARTDTWMVGLLDQPANLYPYQASPTAQRAAAPVTELLFPSPILAFNYAYTTTGVLEQVPTLENGDAQLQKSDVYLDAAGNITTTVTEVITQVDQLVVTYRWNRDLAWSDGTPVTAADSVFAYEVARAAPPNGEALDRLADTITYEAVDEHTTRAVLQPDLTGTTYFLTYWTPLPRHLLQDIPLDQIRVSDFASNPVGYGPYAIEERAQGQIRMVRNEYYFGTAPAASHLTISFLPSVELLHANLLNENLDVVAADRIPVEQFDVLDRDSDVDNLQVAYTPNPVWEHIDFNLDIQLLKDVRVRRAIAYGTNRQAMADQLFKGHSPVLDSWVLPGQLEAAPPDQITRYPYNPDQARALLDEGGYVDSDGDGIRSSPDDVTLTLQLMTTENTNNPIRATVAQQFQQDMRAIGIDVDIAEVPADELYAEDGPLRLRQFELALFGWSAAPSAAGRSLWSCNAIPSAKNGWSGDNFSGWCFRDASQAILKGSTSLDLTERRDAHIRQQQLWTQELPSLPLFQRLSFAATAPALRGPRLDPFAPITWNVAEWRRET